METSIDLSWTTPLDGASPIFGYRIEKSTSGGAFVVEIANTTSIFDKRNHRQPECEHHLHVPGRRNQRNWNRPAECCFTGCDYSSSRSSSCTLFIHGTTKPKPKRYC
jgi:hypothetical protein